MNTDLADIQTQLKRSYYRGVGLRLTREQVRELFKRDVPLNARLYAELFIDEQGEAHFICHTKDDDFLGTKEAFRKFIALLERQMSDEKECPFYKSVATDAVKGIIPDV